MASLVEKRLGKLPQDLRKIYHETYTERFDEYQEEEAAIAQSALRWLICSQMPLKSEMFLTLASSSTYQRPTMSISRDDLLDLCLNFVVHDTGLNVFRFSHLSVREYLESTEPYQLESCHAFAAEYCLRTLTSDLSIIQKPFDGHEEYVVDSSANDAGVDRYVCVYWPHHLKQSGMQRHVEPLKNLFYAFTMEQQITAPHFSSWNEKRSLFQDESRYGRRYSCEDFVVSFPSDPLFVACVWGFEELLHWRVLIDTRSLGVQNCVKMTALHITCQLGNVEAARMLIENGMSREATVNGWTALKLAVGHHHPDVVQLLIHSGLCSNRYIQRGLHYAISKGYTVMAHKLMDLGASIGDVSSDNDKQCCAFHLAVLEGQSLVVKKMLKSMRVSAIEKVAWLVRTRLINAVDTGADVTALFQRDGFESMLDQGTLQTALWIAHGQRDVKAAKVLIDAGADVNLGRLDENCWIGQHNSLIATSYGFGKLLLEATITESMRVDFIELLLDSGALIDPPAFQGQRSPLEAAIRAGREDIVSMLIERGARIDRTDYELATSPADLFLGSLLDMAESRGHVAIARLLSRRGVPSAVRRLTNQQYEELKRESIYELE